MTTVKCPTCRKQVAWSAENRYRPFCSERCKQIDLGAWAAEKYTITSDTQDGDSDESEEANRLN
jgi:endogenous inhibitor of DNA gyrase (YacG/DUF329 family)